MTRGGKFAVADDGGVVRLFAGEAGVVPLEEPVVEVPLVGGEGAVVF
jgi:hydrogenase maturation factor HypE